MPGGALLALPQKKQKRGKMAAVSVATKKGPPLQISLIAFQTAVRMVKCY